MRLFLFILLIALHCVTSHATQQAAQELISKVLQPMLKGREKFYKISVSQNDKGTWVIVQSGNERFQLGRYYFLLSPNAPDVAEAPPINVEAKTIQGTRVLQLSAAVVMNSKITSQSEAIVRSTFRSDLLLHPMQAPNRDAMVPTPLQNQILTQLKELRSSSLQKGKPLKAIVVLPPGSGKTFLAGKAIQEQLAPFKDQPFMVIFAVQNKEILEDATLQLQKTLGLSQAQVSRAYGDHLSEKNIFDKEHTRLFATTRTTLHRQLENLSQRLERFKGPVFFVLDEAHHAGKADGEFDRILQTIQPELKPQDMVLGLSATPWHLESDLNQKIFDNNILIGLISDQEKEDLLLTKRYIALARLMMFRAMVQGYLSPIFKYRQIRYVEGDLNVLARDYLYDWDMTVEGLSQSEQFAKIRKEIKIHVPVVKKMLEEIKANAQLDREEKILKPNRGIIFVPSIAHAEVYAALVNKFSPGGQYRVEAKAYHSGMKDEQRALTMDWIRDEEARQSTGKRHTSIEIKQPHHKYLLVINTLGEGVDIPEINHIILAKSYADHDAIGMRELLQNIGRASRLAYGKTRFNISDFTGDMRRLLFKDMDQQLINQMFIAGGEKDFESLPAMKLRAKPQIETKTSEDSQTLEIKKFSTDEIEIASDAITQNQLGQKPALNLPSAEATTQSGPKTVLSSPVDNQKIAGLRGSLAVAYQKFRDLNQQQCEQDSLHDHLGEAGALDASIDDFLQKKFRIQFTCSQEPKMEQMFVDFCNQIKNEDVQLAAYDLLGFYIGTIDDSTTTSKKHIGQPITLNKLFFPSISQLELQHQISVNLKRHTGIDIHLNSTTSLLWPIFGAEAYDNWLWGKKLDFFALLTLPIELSHFNFLRGEGGLNLGPTLNAFMKHNLSLIDLMYLYVTDPPSNQAFSKLFDVLENFGWNRQNISAFLRKNQIDKLYRNTPELIPTWPSQKTNDEAKFRSAYRIYQLRKIIRKQAPQLKIVFNGLRMVEFAQTLTIEPGVMPTFKKGHVNDQDLALTEEFYNKAYNGLARLHIEDLTATGSVRWKDIGLVWDRIKKLFAAKRTIYKEPSPIEIKSLTSDQGAEVFLDKSVQQAFLHYFEAHPFAIHSTAEELDTKIHPHPRLHLLLKLPISSVLDSNRLSPEDRLLSTRAFIQKHASNPELLRLVEDQTGLQLPLYLHLREGSHSSMNLVSTRENQTSLELMFGEDDLERRLGYFFYRYKPLEAIAEFVNIGVTPTELRNSKFLQALQTALRTFTTDDSILKLLDSDADLSKLLQSNPLFAEPFDQSSIQEWQRMMRQAAYQTEDWKSHWTRKMTWKEFFHAPGSLAFFLPWQLHHLPLLKNISIAEYLSISPIQWTEAVFRHKVTPTQIKQLSLALEELGLVADPEKMQGILNSDAESPFRPLLFLGLYDPASLPLLFPAPAIPSLEAWQEALDVLAKEPWLDPADEIAKFTAKHHVVENHRDQNWKEDLLGPLTWSEGLSRGTILGIVAPRLLKPFLTWKSYAKMEAGNGQSFFSSLFLYEPLAELGPKGTAEFRTLAHKLFSVLQKEADAKSPFLKIHVLSMPPSALRNFLKYQNQKTQDPISTGSPGSVHNLMALLKSYRWQDRKNLIQSLNELGLNLPLELNDDEIREIEALLRAWPVPLEAVASSPAELVSYQSHLPTFAEVLTSKDTPRKFMRFGSTNLSVNHFRTTLGSYIRSLLNRFYDPSIVYTSTLNDSDINAYRRILEEAGAYQVLTHPTLLKKLAEADRAKLLHVSNRLTPGLVRQLEELDPIFKTRINILDPNSWQQLISPCENALTIGDSSPSPKGGN